MNWVGGSDGIYGSGMKREDVGREAVIRYSKQKTAENKRRSTGQKASDDGWVVGRCMD